MKQLFALLLFSLSLHAQVDSTATTLNSVEIAARQQSKEITVGNGNKKDAVLTPYFSDRTMVGKLFPYQETYAATPYLQGVEIFTRNKAKATASFRLHLYKKTTDSLPGEELVPGGIMATAKRGNKKTKTDLTAYNLIMPAEGLIVAFEWLTVDSNSYAYEATGKFEDGEWKIVSKKERAITYAPDIYMNDMPQPISYYFKDYWQKFLMNQWARSNGNWTVPAINITLSN